MAELIRLCSDLDDMFEAKAGTAAKTVVPYLQGRRKLAQSLHADLYDDWVARQVGHDLVVVERPLRSVSSENEGLVRSWDAVISQGRCDARKDVAICLKPSFPQLESLIELCSDLDSLLGAESGTAEKVVFERLAERNPKAKASRDHVRDAWKIREGSLKPVGSPTSAVIELVNYKRNNCGDSGLILNPWTVMATKYDDTTTGVKIPRTGLTINVSGKFMNRGVVTPRPSSKVREMRGDMLKKGVSLDRGWLCSDDSDS